MTVRACVYVSVLTSIGLRGKDPSLLLLLVDDIMKQINKNHHLHKGILSFRKCLTIFNCGQLIGSQLTNHLTFFDQPIDWLENSLGER